MRKFKVLPIALLCNGDKAPKPHGTIVTEGQLTGTPEQLIADGFIEEVFEEAPVAKQAPAKAAPVAKQAPAKAAPAPEPAVAEAVVETPAAAPAEVAAPVEEAPAAEATAGLDPTAILNQGK